jgi:hypothetical protein
MPRIAMDTRAQNTWKETIEKEAATRINYKFAPKDETSKDEDEWFVRSKYTKSAPTVPKMQTITFPPRPEKKNPAQNVANIVQELKSSDKDLLSDMKPPKENVKKLLYDGFTKEEKGRYQYLKARKSDDPESKYEYPLLSSFEYGWKLNEVSTQYKTPANGRSKIVEESFYRRNGVF